MMVVVATIGAKRVINFSRFSLFMAVMFYKVIELVNTEPLLREIQNKFLRVSGGNITVNQSMHNFVFMCVSV
jgi:hypothetical protein